MIIVTLHKPLTPKRLDYLLRNFIQKFDKKTVSTIHIDKIDIKLKNFTDVNLLENLTIDRQNLHSCKAFKLFTKNNYLNLLKNNLNIEKESAYIYFYFNTK